MPTLSHGSTRTMKAAKTFLENLLSTFMPRHKQYLLAVIIALGAAARLYNLGTPSLWGDEIQVLFGAQAPLGSLWEWIARHEVHPPFFHVLMKLVGLAGISDEALRLPWALCGIASIYLIYKLGEEAYSSEAGFVAAALLASNPLHIWLSRMVRPYALLILLCLVAYVCLIRFVKSGNRRDLFTIVACNFFLLILHLNSLMIVGSQGFVLLLAVLCKKIKWKQLFQFGLLAVLSFVPSILVFVTATSRADMTAPFSYGEVWNKSLYNLDRAVDFYGTGWLAWVVGLACLAGAFHAARTRKWVFLFLGSLVVLPLAAIILRRYGAYYNPWHVSHMLVAILTFAGIGVAWIVRFPAVVRAGAVMGALALVVFLFVKVGDRLYGPDAVIISWYDPAHFKTLAREFPDFEKNRIVSFDDAFIVGGTSWYLNRFRALNPVEQMSLSPDRDSATLMLLSSRSDFSRIPVEEKAIPGAELKAHSRIDTQNVWVFSHPRVPPRVIDSTPWLAGFDMNPGEVLGRARSLTDMTLKFDHAWRLFPSRQDASSSVEFDFENKTPAGPQLISLAIPFRNAGAGNTITAYVTFDEEPAQVFPVSKGPDIRSLQILRLQRAEGYRKLNLRLEVFCSAETPEYLTGAMETLSLHGVRLAVCQDGNDGPCSEEVNGWFGEQLRGMYLGSGFKVRAPGQRLLTPLADFSKMETEYPSWSMLTPKDPSGEAVLRQVVDGEGDFVFYPRVGKDSSIAARLVLPGGERKDLLFLPGVQKWTIIGARYPLSIPKGAELEIVLKGPWAQLWVKDGQIVFHR
ncbi:MAG: glycosyltransferase family 39 protein [Acidobacteriota bacterium]